MANPAILQPSTSDPIPTNTIPTTTVLDGHPITKSPSAMTLSQTQSTAMVAMDTPSMLTQFLTNTDPETSLMADLGSTPGATSLGLPMSMPLPIAGGIGMGLTLSEMGMGLNNLPTTVKKDADAERRIKVDGVLKSLLRTHTSGQKSGQRLAQKSGQRLAQKSGMGRISDEGVRRVGRWAGFDVAVEAKYDTAQYEGNRPIVIAGRNAVLVDLRFKDKQIDKVEVNFMSEDENVTAHQKEAADVLKKNLMPENDIPFMNSRLDKFAANLEALARLDKLSLQGLNCSDAITGIYTSLMRLYEYERDVARSVHGNEEHKVVQDVLLRKSGKPSIHNHKRIGVNIDYWHPFITIQEDIEDDDLMYSLELTVESCDATIFPAIRISPHWLGNPIMGVFGTSTIPMINWLEPIPTLITNTIDPEAMMIDSNVNSSLPSVRFLVRLHPPVILPFQAASQALQSVGLLSPLATEKANLYHELLLSNHDDSTTHKSSIVRERFFKRGTRDVIHKSSFNVEKQETGFELTEIPFSHPKQIITLLPILRQWACLSHLLSTSFPNNPTLPNLDESSKPIGQMSLDDLLQKDTVDLQSPTNISIILDTDLTSPSITLFFPSSSRQESLNVTINVLSNGEMIITEQNILSNLPSLNGDVLHVDYVNTEKKRMIKALKIVCDLGIWIEWIQKTYSR